MCRLAASYFAWAGAEKRSDLVGGGLHLPSAGDGLYRFEPPRGFSARAAATLGDARDESASDPRGTITKLRVNWVGASARQLKRVLADSESGNSELANYVDEVPEHGEICQVFDKAPHVPTAGTPAVSMFNEKVQVDLHFWDEIFALRAILMFPKHSLLYPVQ